MKCYPLSPELLRVVLDGFRCRSRCSCRCLLPIRLSKWACIIHHVLAACAWLFSGNSWSSAYSADLAVGPGDWSDLSSIVCRGFVRSPSYCIIFSQPVEPLPREIKMYSPFPHGTLWGWCCFRQICYGNMMVEVHSAQWTASGLWGWAL